MALNLSINRPWSYCLDAAAIHPAMVDIIRRPHFTVEMARAAGSGFARWPHW